MAKPRPGAAFSALAFFAGAVLRAQPGRTDPQVEVINVAEGVYAVLRAEHPDEQPGHGNSVIIINDEDVVVVDATRMPSQARKIIAAVRALTNKPIRTLIHTHWHDDHVYGNQAFAEAFPGLEVIAHQNTRQDMLEISLKRNLPGYKKDYPAFVAQIEERLKDASRPLSSEGRGQLERMAARVVSQFGVLDRAGVGAASLRRHATAFLDRRAGRRSNAKAQSP
jgi:glyoxylase-like metal-dependent hydrolase (beta-lactamase superfamily II)